MASRRNIIIPVDELKRLYVIENKTTTQIGELYDVSRATILWRLKKVGVPLHEARIPGMDKKTLERLYIDKEWSTTRIAEHLGAKTDETVRKALQRYGIPIRSKSEAGRLKVMTPEHLAKVRASAATVNKGQYGANHPAWKNARWKDRDGYVLMSVRGKSMKEHRYLMEQHLGRPLDPWEEVDHKNLIKDDNRLENLEVISSEHKRRDWHRRRGLPIP